MAGNPDMARFLARLPPELAASFSRAQLEAIELHFAMRSRVAHAIDWRRRIMLPGLRAYIVLLAGRERKV
ncbi:hypothetical protein [Acidocella sp. KAb 2-4]|uniref:hypothetical protein n=1 Tax=Acidocella sp. KAb 2-4 TaxID=2885158 RepID=UPI001D091C6C|nr:hypothetical protein [Acidocella sp. KAb 2-4]MCB5943207.1 hypothetical protein [Acidocella sp. KAb 2-4]